MTHGSWEYGDCYVSDIKSVATEVYSNEDETYMIVTSQKGEKVDWEEIIHSNVERIEALERKLIERDSK